MVDMPKDSVIVGGLSTWEWRNKDKSTTRVIEPRLSTYLADKLQVASLELYAPPPAEDIRYGDYQNVGAFTFPTWFVTIDDGQTLATTTIKRQLVSLGDAQQATRRPYRWQFQNRGLTPVRFVCGCTRGHVQDIDWRAFTHNGTTTCGRAIYLEESGATSDLRQIVAVCDCGARRPMYDASEPGSKALGRCSGYRPWLGIYAKDEGCDQTNRLLVRTASNAYFPLVFPVISLPEATDKLSKLVEELWPDISGVVSTAEVGFLRRLQSKIRDAFNDFSDDEIFGAVEAKRTRSVQSDDRTPKEIELDVLDCGKPTFGRDERDSVLFGETLGQAIWARTGDPLLQEITDKIERVVLLHRLREVAALTGFTRFEPLTIDENGELDIGARSAALDTVITWLPAIENRGEGVFLSFKPDEVAAWAQNAAVKERYRDLLCGFDKWREANKTAKRMQYPALTYILLHSVSHMLLQRIALGCGYPLTSLRERVYAVGRRSGILIYTSSSDAEGTLGGLANTGRRIVEHLAAALREAQLCSNDPICAEHRPDDGEGRFLHGAACHGCLFLPETSCEIRNDFLDRALVVPTMSTGASAFFQSA
jgi:hypothetical protein